MATKKSGENKSPKKASAPKKSSQSGLAPDRKAPLSGSFKRSGSVRDAARGLPEKKKIEIQASREKAKVRKRDPGDGPVEGGTEDGGYSVSGE